ncbi:hypothetical protein TCAL_02313 [Tigriopus californicus]|uniref:receptor protein-tyrosine kinase n=2 Tax=Tigriopus californicus TaxID=6832 RepID=A0A553NNN4_TIGCA|nr:hypothetical protein TCAL_02313 [Tigriopus californicus]|eukprot:TCALIF_02313-PA protein Name:"Similar to INSR Insulin receptor (Homo sapiens)" AED:0.04 eAED:0.04 QI:1347/0.9/0.72/1/0.7/0.63/11/386/987
MFPQRTPEHRVKIYRTVDGVRYPGRVFINYNPHLCKEEVEAVLGPTLNDSQVSDKTNGDKAQCNPMHLKVNTTARLSDFGGTEIRLEFKNFQKTIFDMNQVDDLRVFKTFQVHYRKLELPTFKAQNLTKYGQRDLCLEQCSNSANRASSSSSGTNRPCDKSVWQTVEFEPIGSDTNESSLTWPNEVLRITDVEPNTYYGLFVTTLLVREYMVNQKFSGAESEIIYIKSPVYYPSKPEGLSIVNINYTTFNIMWEPPSSPNGEIDHYELLLELKSNSLVLERNDNFCDKQFQNGFIDSKTDKESNVTATNVSEDKQLPEDDIQKQLCACSSSQCQQSDNQVVQGPITEENRISKDVFQTLVINSAFPTRENFPGNDNDDESTETKAKRSIRDDADEQITTKDNLVPEVHIDSGSTSTWVQTLQREDNAYRVFYTPVPSQKTSFQATYLKHFGEYSVKLRACHAPKWVGETFVKWCSLPAFQNPLVYPKPGADDIAESSLHYRLSNGSDPTWLIWDPPKDPNGHILSYLIRYKSDANGTDVSHSCISANDFEKFGNRFPLPMKESYFVSVKAISMSAQGNWTNFIWVDQSSETRSVHWFIIAPIALMFLILAFIVSYLYFRWVQEKQRKSTFATQNPNYCPMEYIADEWEIKRASVIIGEKIGKGAFAVVHKGTYVNPKGGPTEVAIKMPHEDAEHLECMQFLQEAHLMKEIKAVHVVQLVGVVSVNLPYMVLLEYMALGDLRTYLTTHRPNSEFNLTNKPPPTFARMYQMALEIADGMAYLANQIKSVVHRDLAARNCLVSAQGIVKIADFGMARQVYDNYQKHGPGKMPVRWMSPEALRGEFSTKTDVWSYGVVLWEIVTLGDLPYPGLSHNEVMQFVDHQKVMPKPESCPEHFYSLMRRCWHRHLWQRPTFLDIAQELQPWANERFLRESYLTSQEGKSALKAQREPKRQEENVPIDPWASSTAEECIPLTQNGGSPRMHGVGKEG